MKHIFIILPFILFTHLSATAQLLNQKLTNDKTGEEILIGACTIEAFQKGKFEKWYREEYGTYRYNLKKRVLDSIKPYLDSIKFTVVMGTWCEDSRFHFPHFMSVIDYLKIPEDQLTIIAVDRNKNAAIIPTDYLNIVRVPTFIVYKKDKELGRIIEAPVESMEEDLFNIFKGRYTQNQ